MYFPKNLLGMKTRLHGTHSISRTQAQQISCLWLKFIFRAWARFKDLHARADNPGIQRTLTACASPVKSAPTPLWSTRWFVPNDSYINSTIAYDNVSPLDAADRESRLSPCPVSIPCPGAVPSPTIRVQAKFHACRFRFHRYCPRKRWPSPGRRMELWSWPRPSVLRASPRSLPGDPNIWIAFMGFVNGTIISSWPLTLIFISHCGCRQRAVDLVHIECSFPALVFTDPYIAGFRSS